MIVLKSLNLAQRQVGTHPETELRQMLMLSHQGCIKDRRVFEARHLTLQHLLSGVLMLSPCQLNSSK